MSEEVIRSQSCFFIRNVGIKLKMPQLTIASAIVFFHKFFERNSILGEDLFKLSTSCIFLAGKVEETPKKLQDVISVSYLIRFNRELKIPSQEFVDIRESVLKRERMVLQTIGFRFSVAHPYQYILQYNQELGGSRDIAQAAWNFVNDGLRTRLCLTRSPQAIAAATIYLATRYHEKDMPVQTDANGRKTFLQFKVEELEEICNKILDLYTSSESTDPSVQPKASSKPSSPQRHSHSIPNPNAPNRIQPQTHSTVHRLRPSEDPRKIQEHPLVLRTEEGRPLPVAQTNQAPPAPVVAPNHFDALFDSLSDPTPSSTPASPQSDKKSTSIPSWTEVSLTSADNSGAKADMNVPETCSSLVMRKREVSPTPSTRFAPY